MLICYYWFAFLDMYQQVLQHVIMSKVHRGHGMIIICRVICQHVFVDMYFSSHVRQKIIYQ